MFLKSLSLLNYKNFESIDFEFDHKINCLVGNNGVGKTNILDAIYHLSFGKSYFNPVTSQNIRPGTDFFVIDGLYEKNEREEKVIVSTKRGQNKVIKRNGTVVPYTDDKISVAITKAFLAVEGGTAAASPRIRELVNTFVT